MELIWFWNGDDWFECCAIVAFAIVCLRYLLILFGWFRLCWVLFRLVELGFVVCYIAFGLGCWF